MVRKTKHNTTEIELDQYWIVISEPVMFQRLVTVTAKKKLSAFLHAKRDAKKIASFINRFLAAPDLIEVHYSGDIGRLGASLVKALQGRAETVRRSA